MAHLKRVSANNPWPFPTRRAVHTVAPITGKCARRSSLTVPEAMKQARKAGSHMGDTHLFTVWLCERGLQDRGNVLINRLQGAFNQGVEDGETPALDALVRKAKAPKSKRALPRTGMFADVFKELERDSNPNPTPKYTREQLERMPTETLDRMAFGFASGATKTVPVVSLHPTNDDIENAKYAAGRYHGGPVAWARTVSFSEPIEVKLKGGRLLIVDGHHRYYAATLLRKKTLRAVVEIDDNAVDAILGREGNPKRRGYTSAEQALFAVGDRYRATGSMHAPEPERHSVTVQGTKAWGGAADHSRAFDTLEEANAYAVEQSREYPDASVEVYTHTVRNPARGLRGHLREGLEGYDSIAGPVYKYTAGLPSTIGHAVLGSKNPYSGEVMTYQERMAWWNSLTPEQQALEMREAEARHVARFTGEDGQVRRLPMSAAHRNPDHEAWKRRWDAQPYTPPGGGVKSLKQIRAWLKAGQKVCTGGGGRVLAVRGNKGLGDEHFAMKVAHTGYPKGTWITGGYCSLCKEHNPAGIPQIPVHDVGKYGRTVGPSKATLANIRKEHKRAGRGEIVQVVDSTGKHVAYSLLMPHGERSNPAAGFEKLNSFLGVYGGKVYKYYEDSNRIQGTPIMHQGAWADTTVAYSDGLEWNRAYEGRVGSTTVITVPWAGGRKEFFVHGNAPLKTLAVKETKAVKAKAPKGASVYNGYYYKRVSTPWGMKYFAAESPEGLVEGSEAFATKSKDELFRMIDEYGSRRSNPEGLFDGPPDTMEAADNMYEDFHGSAPTETIEIETEIVEPLHVAVLGTMVSLKVETITGLALEITFDGDVPYLTSNAEGTQIYFDGGDQAIDLAKIKMAGEDWEKPSMMIGDLVETTYRTQKKFDKFATIDYYHANGEESGYPPQLLYDPINQLLAVTGGRYKVKPEGIVD